MANKTQKLIIQLNPELVKEITGGLIKHGSLKINDFGMFKLKRTKGSKNALNPYTQKRQVFKPKTKINFRPVKKFKDKIQLWKR